MAMFLVVLLVMLSVIGAMSIGVLMGRKPIAGSCGGLNALGMKSACEICGGDDSKCEKETARKQGVHQQTKDGEDLAYDAFTAGKP